MWPFIQNNKKLKDGFSKTRKTLNLEQLTEGIGDISELAKNNVALKFWIPEPVSKGINELSDLYGITSSKMLRDFLLTHCYGVYFLAWLNEYKASDLGKNNSMPMFSRKPAFKHANNHTPIKEKYFVPELGKNISSIKLWIPEKLKIELGLLAKNTELSLSNYTREIITSRLLGHGTLPMRPKMMAINSTQAADNWNNEIETDLKEVDEHEYSDISGGKIES